MAEPIDRPEPDRQARLAPEDLSARFLRALEEHGVLEFLTAAVEQSDRLLAILVRELAQESRTRTLRNALMLLALVEKLPAEELERIWAEEPPSRIGFTELWRRLRSPAARRGLYRLTRVLEALGAETGSLAAKRGLRPARHPSARPGRGA